MSQETKTESASIKIQSSAKDILSKSDTGRRQPSGLVGRILILVILTWSLFQIYISSNVPFWLFTVLGINLTFNSDEARAIHLAFAIFLASIAFPLFITSLAGTIFSPWVWILVGFNAGIYFWGYAGFINFILKMICSLFGSVVIKIYLNIKIWFIIKIF